MSFEPQIPANPSSPVIVTGDPISSDDNSSQITQLIQPTATYETLQIQESKYRDADIEKGAPNDHDLPEYKSLVKRFNFKVVLSTFACVLVVAYLTFINNVARATGSINHAHGIPFNIFMLLAYLSIILHALSAIISSRGAVLCSDPELIGGKKYTVKYFKDILSICQHLNLYGILLFVPAVLGSSYFVFEHYAYTVAFCGCSFVVVVLIFSGKYWKLSLIHWDLTRIWNGIKTFRRGGK